MHHKIVGLEAIHIPYPDFNVAEPHTAESISYPTTAPSELIERIKDASIIIMSTVKISAETLSPEVTPNLKAIASMSSGTDHIDLEAAKKRGVVVMNCPHANAEVVANHAIGLYFAARRRVVMMHNKTMQVPSEWKEKGSIVRYMTNAAGDAPLDAGDEVCGILGYGFIGKRIEELAKALGMQVIVADRKNASKPPSSGQPPRLPFAEVLKRSTVIIVVVPKSQDTINLISEPELQSMHPHALIINISRGGIINEAAIVSALRRGTIAGYAGDVFENEPAEGAKDSPLLAPDVRDLNITLSPHAAWFGERTRRNNISILKRNVETFVAGNIQNRVI